MKGIIKLVFLGLFVLVASVSPAKTYDTDNKPTVSVCDFADFPIVAIESQFNADYLFSNPSNLPGYLVVKSEPMETRIAKVPERRFKRISRYNGKYISHYQSPYITPKRSLQIKT